MGEIGKIVQIIEYLLALSLIYLVIFDYNDYILLVTMIVIF